MVHNDLKFWLKVYQSSPPDVEVSYWFDALHADYNKSVYNTFLTLRFSHNKFELSAYGNVSIPMIWLIGFDIQKFELKHSHEAALDIKMKAPFDKTDFEEWLSIMILKVA